MSAFAVPIATAYVAGTFADSASQRDADARLVELAVQVLSEAPNRRTVDLRLWAVDILNAHSRVGMTPDVRRLLADTLSWPSVVRVDVKVNGQDGPVRLLAGQPYTFTWSAQNATACDITEPVVSGISTSGATSIVPSPRDGFYPQPGETVALKVTCMNPWSSSVDIVQVWRP